ncbi:MAG TPA: hypothetical protein VHG71_11535 [Verrucomicrobiae bacterium]|nr:hypothetical protein [Verrucomicrobiae bacterium]
MSVDTKAQAGIWHLIMTNLVFELLKEKTEVTVEDMAEKFRVAEVPPIFANRSKPYLIKSFKASGHLKRTNRYILSELTGRPLVVYAVVQPTAKPSCKLPVEASVSETAV